MAISPAKRPVAQLSEDDDDEITESQQRRSAIKRIKRESGLDDDHPPVEGEASLEASQLSRDNDSVRDESSPEPEQYSDGEDDGGDDEDDEAIIRAYEAVRAKHGTSYGWASDVGVIKQVILIDFMCHKHFSVSFGERMNFLVGHNGSGKSAILTGIAVALGGKAAITGRGQGLKELIRRGADKAVVTVVIANNGPEAFKPDVYGPQIVIERTIEQNGSSNYKFRATRDGKILAKKRDELSQICSAFCINIDSPLTILTQDNARSFLQNATDDSLYKFFLDGTSLSSLSEAYEKLKNDVDRLGLFSSRQKELIPDKEAEVERLNRIVQTTQRLSELQVRITRLSGEMAWTYVKDKEKEHAENVAKVEELRAKVADLLAKKEDSERNLAPMDGEVETAQKEVKDFDDSRLPLQESRAKTRKKLEGAKQLLQSTQVDIRNFQKQVKNKTSQIASLEQDITKKQAELNQAETAEQRANRENLEKHKALLQKLQETIPRKERALPELRDQLAAIDREHDDLQIKMTAASGAMQKHAHAIDSLRRQAGSRLSAFGTGLEQILRAIDDQASKGNWKGAKPIGPLGLFVNLEDPMYRNVISSIMGSYLCGFAITDRADQRRLMGILQSNTSYRPGLGSADRRVLPPIVTHAGEAFDWSRGDLQKYGPTILSKLRIDNEDVLRILINQHRIERIFVAPSVQHANSEINRMIGQGMPQAEFVSADGFRAQGQGQASRSSFPIESWRGNPLFYKDLAADIAEQEKGKQAEEAFLTSAKAQLVEVKSRRAAKQAEVDKIESESRQARTGITGCQRTIAQLEQKIEERPDDVIAGLELSKAEAEKDLASKQSNLDELQKDLPGYEETVQKLQDEVNELETKWEEFGSEREKRSKALAARVELRTKARNELQHLTNSHQNWTRKLADKESDMEKTAEEVELWTDKARAMHPERADTRKTIDQIKKEKEALMKAREDAEKRHGVTYDEIYPRWQKAQKELEVMKRSSRALEAITAILRRRIKTRQNFWTDARNSIAVRARTLFIVLLEKRNLSGKLVFDHASRRLSLRVEPSGSGKKRMTSANASEPAQFRVPKNLSGGERSFATVSLLLSLWDTASCPIRCLDEWDVFLDSHNRGVAAKLLIEGARESEGKQFILITPQDLHGLRCEGPGNKLIRLDDPIRNQTTLNFAPPAGTP